MPAGSEPDSMIALICTLEPQRISWLPQLVQHYRSLGVERFLLTLQLEPSTAQQARDRDYERFLVMLSSLGIGEGSRLDNDFYGAAVMKHQRTIVEQHLGSEDWIVWCDTDEFQVYPAPLPEIVKRCDAQRIDFLRGAFVDRVAADYSLAVFDGQSSIWDTFPRAVNVTMALAHGDPRKVVLARKSVKVSAGKHEPTSPGDLKTIVGWVQVHHFKWDATLPARLRYRVRPEWRARFPWWEESQRLLDYFAANHWRFNPADLTPIALTGRELISARLT